MCLAAEHKTVNPLIIFYNFHIINKQKKREKINLWKGNKNMLFWKKKATAREKNLPNRLDEIVLNLTDVNLRH